MLSLGTYLALAGIKFFTQITTILPFFGLALESGRSAILVCFNDDLIRFVFLFIPNLICIVLDQIWLMARNRLDFPIEIRTKIHDALIQLGLDPDRLVLSKNKDCPNAL